MCKSFREYIRARPYSLETNARSVGRKRENVHFNKWKFCNVSRESFARKLKRFNIVLQKSERKFILVAHYVTMLKT